MQHDLIEHALLSAQSMMAEHTAEGAARIFMKLVSGLEGTGTFQMRGIRRVEGHYTIVDEVDEARVPVHTELPLEELLGTRRPFVSMGPSDELSHWYPVFRRGRPVQVVQMRPPVPGAELRADVEAATHLYACCLSRLDNELRDPLTGLYSRSTFEMHLPTLIGSTREADLEAAFGEAPWRLILIHVQEFGDLNQRHGYLLGDEMLLWIAQRMRLTFTRQSLLFRFGARRFAVALGDVNLDQAAAEQRRLVQTLANQPFPGPEPVRLTAGVTTLHLDEPAPALISRADRALRWALAADEPVAVYSHLLAAGALHAGPPAGSVELF